MHGKEGGASTGSSQLPVQQQEDEEEAALGVQGLFSELLKVKPPGNFYLHDVHTKTSVCDDLKPDIVVSRGAQCMPVNTALILDLKRQGGQSEYCGHANIYQVGHGLHFKARLVWCSFYACDSVGMV
jgi:hypothetical protein